MFEAVFHEGVVIGHAWTFAGVTYFFGTAEGTRDRLVARYPAYEFAWLRQVHGRAVVTARADVVDEADAHVTDRRGLAAVVVTADCVPVLLASDTRVCGVHAGWRGVEADVIGAALATFPADDPVRTAAIGPHLGQVSFEVGRDVAARLERVAPRDTYTRAHADPDKVYFDLTKLARAQVTTRAANARVVEFTPDTLTSPAYHSYRRAGAAAGRNLSFVVRNP